MERTQEWDKRYCETPEAWLIIRPDWTCIINWTEPYYMRLEWNPEKTGDFNIQNQKYILENKYYELKNIVNTFNL